jgi:hypothetical protein
MKLTSDTFERSVISLANGSDPQPVLRTSHFTGVQIWPTCGGGPADFQRSFEQKLARVQERWPDALELTGVEPLDQRGIQAGPVMPLPGGFPADQEAAFRKVSEAMAREGSWGRVLQLTRRLGFGIERRVRVFVLAGEGLATYAALSFGGRLAPLALVTVQQGNFENPSGLMNHALKAWRRSGHGGRGPRFWLRGKWGMDAPEGGAWTDWSTLVRSYSGWDSRLDAEEILREPPTGTVARVKAWSRWDDPVLSLPDQVVVPVSGGRKLTLRRGRLDDQAVDMFDLAVTSEAIASGLDRRDRIVTWRELTGRTDPSLAQVLEAMGRDEHVRGARRVVVTLVGFEDEGAILPRWLAGAVGPEELEVRFLDPLALVDLRAGGGGGLPAERGDPEASRGAPRGQNRRSPTSVRGPEIVGPACRRSQPCEDWREEYDLDVDLEDDPRGSRSSVDSGEGWLAPARLATAGFYPGCYFDLSPLTRYSHLVDRFVLVDHLGQYDESDLGPCELEDRLRARIASVPGMSVTRCRVRSLPWRSCAFVVRLDLVRRIGDVRRRLELLFVKGDAGALFDQAWAPSRVAPAIMIEIQPEDSSGCHGHTDERRCFPDRFAETRAYPKVWVLSGYAPGHLPGAQYAPPGRRPRLVQRYLDVESLAAFSSDPMWMPLRRTVEVPGSGRVATLRCEKLTREGLAWGGFGAVVATERLLDKLRGAGVPPRIELQAVRSDAPFERLLSQVTEVGKRVGTQVPIAAIPVGGEGEASVLLEQWVRSPEKAPPLTIFHKHELDFADLRGWSEGSARRA